MRKLLARIQVWEDDTLACSGVDSPVCNQTENTYQVYLASKPTHSASEKMLAGKSEVDPTILCHELGHVVSQVFKTPVCMRDLGFSVRAKMITGQYDGLACMFTDVAECKYQAEKEAWDWARIIYPGLNEGYAAYALSTYDSYIREATQAENRIRSLRGVMDRLKGKAKEGG